MTAQELFQNIRKRLTPTIGDFATADAQTIIERALNISMRQIYTEVINVADDHIAQIESAVERRLSGEPLPYIFGKAFFFERDFFVNDSVLIPRSDTETLLMAVMDNESKKERAYFIDLCTGCGILAVTLIEQRPDWTALAVDISYKALTTASMNVRDNVNNVRLICCDMFGAIRPKKQFDFIVSNPPYISSSQMDSLDNGVKCFEPITALFGGSDGLDFYRTISKQAKTYLKDNGRVYLEIGYDQGESVYKIFRENGWGKTAVIKDLGNRDRVVICDVMENR